MNKREMAEWLTEKLLEWQGITDRDSSIIYWKSPAGRDYFTLQQRVYFIYSPDGFFAVLGEINNRLAREGVRSIELDLAWYTFFRDMDYKAFYNAVYDALKTP